MQDFKQLKVWQRSHALTLHSYKITKQFPKIEVYGLANQIRRAASSIPTNIAEGCVQSSDAQFARYLFIALGSAAELDYQILLAHELEYIDTIAYNEFQSEVDQVKKMLAAFIGKLTA